MLHLVIVARGPGQNLPAFQFEQQDGDRGCADVDGQAQVPRTDRFDQRRPAHRDTDHVVVDHLGRMSKQRSFRHLHPQQTRNRLQLHLAGLDLEGPGHCRHQCPAPLRPDLTLEQPHGAPAAEPPLVAAGVERVAPPGQKVRQAAPQIRGLRSQGLKGATGQMEFNRHKATGKTVSDSIGHRGRSTAPPPDASPFPPDRIKGRDLETSAIRWIHFSVKFQQNIYLRKKLE